MAPNSFLSSGSSVTETSGKFIFYMGWMVRGSNPGTGKQFISSPERPDRLWAPHSIVSKSHRGSFPGIKRPVREVTHSPPSGAGDKTEWRYAPIPPLCLHDVEKKNFNLRFFYICVYILIFQAQCFIILHTCTHDIRKHYIYVYICIS